MMSLPIYKFFFLYLCVGGIIRAPFFFFCHGNALWSRGLGSAGGNLQAFLFLPTWIKSWAWKEEKEMPHSNWPMRSGGFCLDFVLGYSGDLFSLGSTTVALTVKNFVCFACHFWNRRWIIHCKTSSKNFFLIKKKNFLLLKTFYTHEFWTATSCELSSLLAFDVFLGKMYVSSCFH